MFAAAARLVGPFDGARATELLSAAEAAYAWLEANPAEARDAHWMYASLQLYLATGDDAYHQEFLARVSALDGASYPERYVLWPSLSDLAAGAIISPYFFGYLITDLPTDTATEQLLIGWLEKEADEILTDLTTTGYPLGPRTYVGYGSATNQGRYTDPLILLHRLTGDPIYVDAVSELADYSMGLNPLNKSYTTGLGANPPTNALHLDSYFTVQAGLGQVPGVVVFGPHEDTSTSSYQEVVWQKVSPDYLSLPEQRRYCEGWSLVRVAEFTIKMQGIDACLYAFLDD